jgi:UDP-glucose/iron transport system permease protein
MEPQVLDLNPIVVFVASSLTIVAAVAISWWLGLGVERSILVACVRAAIQLTAVGFVLALVVRSGWEWLLAPIWIVGMIALATSVIVRRTKRPSVRLPAIIALTAAVAMSLGVVFGLGVLPADPIEMIVIAGITLGNVLPSMVLASDQVGRQLTEGRPAIEGLLSLGIDASRATRFIVAEATRVALIPQIERTKVVGLIALPGAFAGLLIAGVDPVDAAVVQLVVMYLVLGSVAVAAAVIALVATRSAFTPDQRLSDR